MRGDGAVRFAFRERMVGPMARGITSPRIGAERGRADGTRLGVDLVVTIDDLERCMAAPDHPARLDGTISFAELAARTPISGGTMQLYVPDSETGMKQIRYRLAFSGVDGATYRLEATKFIRPGRATVREQVTAYARLLAADAVADGEEPHVVAAGVLVFRIRDLPALLWSMRTEGVPRVAGLLRFLAFARRELVTRVPARAS